MTRDGPFGKYGQSERSGASTIIGKDELRRDEIFGRALNARWYCLWRNSVMVRKLEYSEREENNRSGVNLCLEIGAAVVAVVFRSGDVAYWAHNQSSGYGARAITSL